MFYKISILINIDRVIIDVFRPDILERIDISTPISFLLQQFINVDDN